ncbi:hypothetical protein SLEP1_g26398 [Rubroshorea leprosula]|uniref:Uncharacterized protein n=1 Tax=Rubroshorea leprosula TaxID=152421 RepID=A0AAV5JLY6_9ROSI|nr:hypothetical protein SLEP1_g26398 [Rubroshorea leprosula]
MCLPTLRIQKDEHDPSKGTGKEQGQEASTVEVEGESSQVISSKKTSHQAKQRVWPSHPRVKQPSKSDAHKSSTLLASKQIKVKASMPHKAKMPKENEEKTSPLASSEGLDSILIPSNDEVSSKANEAKNVEALTKNIDKAPTKNMDEATTKNMYEPLAQRGIYCKTIASEADEPSLLDSIIGLVDDIFDVDKRRRKSSHMALPKQ